MSTNPVFDEVQALYPDVHVPDMLEAIMSWSGRRIRHVVAAPPPRNLDDLVAEAQEIIRNQPAQYSDFPYQTVRNPGPVVVNIEDRKKLRGPKHGR